jgi:hypothetical protein
MILTGTRKFISAYSIKAYTYLNYKIDIIST